MIYANFASVYDRLMQDVPYANWITYLDRLFDRHGIKPREVLDIGCGTGNVTLPLAELGYSLTGLDLSAEMLAAAEKKARDKGLAIRWIQQDMRAMDLGDTKFDLVISMTDSLNYLNTTEDLVKVFGLVRGLLKPGGWFIFDLNTHYKIREVFGDNIFTLVEEDISYIWENEYDPETQTCAMDLTFFVREADGRYRRFQEQHSETGYEKEAVTDILAQSGFSAEAVYAEDSFEPPVKTTERIYFAAKSL